MDIPLHRHDIFQSGSTSRKSMRVLPLGKRDTQKIAIGDEDGVVTCFSVKKKDTAVKFRSLPEKKGISRLELGMIDPKDKIVVATGSHVKGFTKQGKECMSFDTNSTETIRSLYIDGPKVYAAGEYIYSSFIDGKDADYFMASDRINDLSVMQLSGGRDKLNPIIGCQDRVIRVIEDSEVIREINLDSSPLVLEQFEKSATTEKTVQNINEMLYGTDDGRFGQIVFNRASDELNKGWEVPNEKRIGSVQCLGSADMTGDGVNDIVVGRDDGVLEVYAFSLDPEPSLVFSKSLGESVTAVDTGLIENPKAQSIVLSTYAGRVLSFGSEAEGAATGGPKPDAALEKKVKALRTELAKLHDKLGKEKEKYASMCEQEIAVAPTTRINSKFVLDPISVSYRGVIEIQSPIDVIALHSNVEIDLLDVDSNVAIVSICPPQPDCKLAATYRCQETVNRFELRVRTTEGKSGTITAYIVPRTAPKAAQTVIFPVKPLSLHRRVQLVAEKSHEHLNHLSITGTFSLAEVHSWVALCLPEIPDRPPVEDETTLVFESTHLGTLLKLNYKKGEIKFWSDNIATIAVVKDIITREATQHKTKINIQFEASEESTKHALELVFTKVASLHKLARTVEMLDALKEIQLQEDNVEFMEQYYQNALKNADELRRRHSDQKQQLSMLFDVVKSLFVDSYRMDGLNVEQRVPELTRLLERAELPSVEEVFAFFKQ